MKNDIRCDVCNLPFQEGVIFAITDCEWKKNLFGQWHTAKVRKKRHICRKCDNTLKALVRHNLAIKTSDILKD